MTELAPGTVFAGHRIDGLIGRGGMGVVYRATQPGLDRVVALKVIAPELLEDEESRRRFLRECRLAASLEHPHVIPIYYSGEENGLPYLVMRYVPGDDARRLVRREGALGADRAAAIVTQVASALDAAHSAGLVHRDVKPANILLAEDNHAYLSDFGLTRRVRSMSGASKTRSWVGTLDFIAPEQIRGDEVDARADIYALGSVLFYLLTAEVPFPRDSDEAKMWAQLTEPPPVIDSPLNAVIQRAIAKSPDDRYQSAGDLGRAAQAAAAGISVSEPERTVARGAAAPVGQRTVTQRVPIVAPRRRWTAGAAATLAVAGVAVAVAIMRPTGDRDAAVRATPTPTRTPTASAAQRPRVVATVRWGRRPNSLVPAGDRVWAGAWHSDRVAAIDTSANRVLGRTSHLAPGGTADLVRTKHTLWVLTRAWQLLRLDVQSGRPVAPPIALSMEPTAVAVHGHDVWVAEQADVGIGQIVRLDAKTGALKLAVPAAPGVVGMLYARGRLWSLHSGPNNLVARDAATMQPIKNVPLPGTGVGGLAEGAGALWVTIPDYDQLVRYTLRTGKRITVSIVGRPVGVAVSGSDVWVAASGSSAIQHVGARSVRLIGRPVRVPLNPLAIAISPHGVWVTCVGRNLIARVDVSS